MTQIDPNSSVILKKTYMSPDGNVYFPGEYPPNELPTKAYTTQYVTVKNPPKPLDKVVLEKEETTPVPIIKEQRIKPLVTNPNKDRDVEYVSKETEASIETLKTVESSPLRVNEATFDELVQLNGVGKNTAYKLITAREEGGTFKSFDELNTRVPLALAKKWDRYNIDFS